MDRLLKNLKSTSVKMSLAVFSCLLIIAVSADVTIRNQGGYLILFSLVYVLLPGLLFVAAIDKDFFGRFRVQAFVIAFFCGFGLLIGQFYLLNALGLLHLIKFTPLAVIILLALLSAGNLKKMKLKIDKADLLNRALPYLLLVAITMLASYVALKTSVPDKTSPVHIDIPYHMGNVNILTRAGSFEDTRVMGMTFKYHYFMDLYYAILRNVFPAEIWNCVCRYSILLIPPLAAPGIYSFANSLRKRPVINFVATMFILFFSAITPDVTMFSAHVINNFNNMGLAVTCAMCLIHLLTSGFNRNEYKYTDLISVFITALILTGSKGPLTLIILGTVFVFIFYNAVARHKFSFYQITAFFTILAAFAVIWFTLLNVAINSQTIYTSKQGLERFFDYFAIMNTNTPLYEHAADPLYAFITIPVSLFENFGGAVIPFAIMVPVLIWLPFSRKQRDNINYKTAFLAICTCISLVGAYVLALGNNRLYFLMLATPTIYLTAIGIDELSDKAKTKAKTKVKTVISRVIQALTVCFLLASFIGSFLNPIKFVGLDVPNRSEIVGINWIRENTDEDALFAINDHYPGWKFYYYSGFTERRFYLESYGYAANSGKTFKDLESQDETNAQLFTSENSPVIAQNLGIDYFVYYDTTGKIPEILEKNYKLCFSNDCLRIYSRT